MTDQVPNFTLPSQEAAKSSDSPHPVLRILTTFTKRVVPPLAVIALVLWLAKRLLQRAQEKQLRDFRAQLDSFSSMLDLDGAGKDASTKNAVESATMARQMLGTAGKKYKFRAENTTEGAEEDLAAKVRLDLFRAGSSGGEATSDTRDVKIADVVPDGEYENAIAEGLKKVVEGDAEGGKELVKEGREKAGLGEVEARVVFEKFVSQVVSRQIDQAALNLDSDDRESLENLNMLAGTMAASRSLGPDVTLKYQGGHASGGKIREELYRRYAVFCLSSEERVRNDLQSLVDMQTLLAVDDARAETINTEIAKGMFQVAVSAAMADGSLDEGSREALNKLKDSFGDLLDGGSADSIMSEVAVMRAMYSLQQLLQEQGVTDDDVKELRRMCSELGVDIDNMLQNADALGDALGPEAKEFVESLRGLLSESANGSVVSTTAKQVDQVKDVQSKLD